MSYRDCIDIYIYMYIYIDNDIERGPYPFQKTTMLKSLTRVSNVSSWLKNDMAEDGFEEWSQDTTWSRPGWTE